SVQEFGRVYIAAWDGELVQAHEVGASSAGHSVARTEQQVAGGERIEGEGACGCSRQRRNPAVLQ
ncbi:unnamed protein product, partial [Phaeothamnion confervicola]